MNKWDKFGDKLESYSNTNQKLFYTVRVAISSSFKNEIDMKHWRDYSEELLNMEEKIHAEMDPQKEKGVTIHT